MVIKTNLGFIIELFTLNRYSIELDKYDYIYKNLDESIPAIGIKIIKEEKIIKSAILCGYYSAINNDSIVLDDQNILICVAKNVYCLSLPELNLSWVTETDWSSCFGIYKIMDGYIVHGELEISKLNKNGKIKGQFGGRDIFVTIDGSKSFEIKENYIEAKDWLNFIYKIDFNGKEIK